jgi:hypothetical protein
LKKAKKCSDFNVKEGFKNIHVNMTAKQIAQRYGASLCMVDEKMMKLKPVRRKSKSIELTNGVEVDLAEENGLQLLYHTVFGECFRVLRNTPPFRRNGFLTIYISCIHELYYIAGQLLHLRSDLDIARLESEFMTFWDDMRREIISGISNKNEPKK